MVIDIYNFQELVSSIFAFLFSIFLIFKVGKFMKLTKQEVILIYCWHSLLALIFMINDLNGGHDASGWYSNSSKFDIGATYGNSFMYSFSGLLKFFKLNYIGQNLFYNLLGTTMLYILYSKVKELCKYKTNEKYLLIALTLVFLPGLSFWSSGISKDTISLFGFAVLYYSINNKFNLPLFLIGFIALVVARPFLCFFFFFGFSLYNFLEIFFMKRQKFSRKLFNIFILTLMIIPILITINIGFEYMSMAEDVMYYKFSDIIDVLIDFVNASQRYYATTTNAAIPFDTFIINRYLYFLFMPLSLKYTGIFQSYFVLENLFLILLFLVMLKNIKFNHTNINKLTKIFYLSIFILFLTLPIIFSNYGIALRYKWLVIPYLLLAFLDFRKSGYKKKIK